MVSFSILDFPCASNNVPAHEYNQFYDTLESNSLETYWRGRKNPTFLFYFVVSCERHWVLTQVKQNNTGMGCPLHALNISEHDWSTLNKTLTVGSFHCDGFTSNTHVTVTRKFRKNSLFFYHHPQFPNLIASRSGGFSPLYCCTRSRSQLRVRARLLRALRGATARFAARNSTSWEGWSSTHVL